MSADPALHEPVARELREFRRACDRLAEATSALLTLVADLRDQNHAVTRRVNVLEGRVDAHSQILTGEID